MIVLRPRIIPSLLLHKNGLVKTLKYRKPVYVGDPINAIRIFNEKEVDELLIVDIDASKEMREPNYSLLEQYASECFMPLGYGGGIKTVEQARRIFSIGVEKVVIQTAAMDSPELINHLADIFGSQSIVVSVDVKKNIFGKHKLFRAQQLKNMSLNWQDFITNAVKNGAGEILFKSVDLDGTMAGPDLNLIKQCTQLVDVPVVVQGGVGSLSDIQDCLNVGAAGVAAGAFFVFKGPYRAVLINYPAPNDLDQLKVANNV